MIFLDEKEISVIEYNDRVLSFIYRKGILVWQAIRSCFGAGFWVNSNPWFNNEPYKN